MTHATIVRGGSGITWVHYADDEGRILRTVNVDAGTQTDRNLDARGRLIGIRARDGSRTCQALDVHGLPRIVVDLPAPNEPAAQPALVRALHFGDHERLLSVSPANRREYFAHKLDERGNIAETLFDGDDFVAYSRDERGRVEVVTTPRGRTRLTYDRVTGQPNRVTWAEGLPEAHHKIVRYSGAGLPTEVVEPGRPPVRLEWRKDGLLAAAEADLDFGLGDGPHTVRTAYAYTADGSLAEVVGPETTTSYVTDVRGLVTSKTITDNTESSNHPGSSVSSLSNSGGNAILRRRTWCFGYDGLGALIAEIDPEGRQTRLTRDAHGDVIQVERGVWLTSSEAWATPCASAVNAAVNSTGVSHEVFVRFERDASGRVVNEIFGGDHTQGLTAGGPGGRNRHLTYDGYGRLVASLATNGTVERFGYDDESRVAWMATFRSGSPLPDGSFDEVERPDEHDPNLTSLALYDYDAWSRPVEVRERWFVDDGSNARQDLGEDGWRVWRASYENATGRMSVRGPDGKITVQETDARGRLVSVVERSENDADAGVDVHYNYDWSTDDRRLTYTVRPAATASGEYRQTSFFSPLGVPTRLEDSTGEVLSWTAFDALGRPSERGDRSSTQFFEYNAFGEIVGIDRMDGDGQREPYLFIERTGTGAERALTDGLGHTWQYAYDAAHRLTSVTHPDGSSESRSYFVGSDDVRYATDRTGNTTTFEYDAWGNVRRRQGTAVAVTLGARPDARRRRDREVRYVYDTLGLREATALNDPADPLDDVRQTFVRDSLGRTVSESDARFADTLNLERDAMGRPTRINFGNEAWSRDYDAWGRLMQATARARRGGSTSGSRPSQGGQSGQTTNVARFEYAGLGQPSTVRFGNGAIEMRTFDEEGRRLTGTLMPSSVSGAQPIYQHALYYGTDGHLVRFDQHIAGRTPFSQLFTSDALGRLEGAAATSPVCRRWFRVRFRQRHFGRTIPTLVLSRYLCRRQAMQVQARARARVRVRTQVPTQDRARVQAWVQAEVRRQRGSRNRRGSPTTRRTISGRSRHRTA
ncbi:MAG: RHS repeat protein [Deltaproteobacteria bacterium]|nr:RHS repeat protein [Deltaproteobacteria bacterium]